MADTPVDEFKQQLRNVSERMDQVAEVYPDLSPDSRQESREYVEKTLKAVQKIQKDLEEADRADPDARIVQVIGMNGKVATVEDFQRSFKDSADQATHLNQRNPQLNFPVYSPYLKSYGVEKNYKLDSNLKLQPAVNEWFLEFSKAGDAQHALTLKGFQLRVKDPGCIFSVNFVKPAKDFATRATFRKIGALVDRLKEIDEEYKAIGAVRQSAGMPVMCGGFLDFGYLLDSNCLSKWEEVLASGGVLDHNAYGALRMVPVDMNRRLQTIKTLYNEECRILIDICKFRAVDRIEFYYDRA
jgi:hypothetical protein